MAKKQTIVTKMKKQAAKSGWKKDPPTISGLQVSVDDLNRGL